jgi:glycosyltransferase involved in cell wall biosynthesis
MIYTKVSIQIPTYNQQRFIKKTIESCLMQDYPNLEINIADDHSTDSTKALIEPYLKDKRVRYFTNKTNIGRVANYHKALYEYATGDWAINLDGDDYFTDCHFISRAIALITEANDEKILVYQANHDINKIATVLPLIERINENNIVADGATYFLNYPKILNFHHCATLYKREASLPLNFYSYNCLYTDFNSIAKLFINGRVMFSSENVAVWHQHAGNESATLGGDKISNELEAINELAVFAAKRLPTKAVNQWCKKMNGYLLSNYVDMQTTTKQNRTALKHLLLNFNFDKVHTRQLIKAILGSMG